MSDTSLNVLLWGFGHMNKLMFRYVLEKGHQVVAVLGHHNVGEDAATVADLGSHACLSKLKAKVAISSDSNADEVIKASKPQVAILATRSTMQDVHECLAVLGRNGVNTLTIAEEAFYSWNTSAAITKELDELFKANNASWTGTGAQDILWGYLPASVLGSTHTIKKVKGTIQFNVDDYGRALCEAHGVGMTVAEFEARLGKSEAPTYVWNSNEWLAAMMGWKVAKMTQTISPVVVDAEIYSNTFADKIKAGNASGLKAFVVTECTNGISIETEMIGTVYHGDMIDTCAWKIEGEPDTDLVVRKPATVEVTCASAVNRLAQVVAARNGYVPTFELGLIASK